MKIKILSDLHWETHIDKGKSMCEGINVIDIDVLVIAGDLCDSKNLYKSYEYLSKLPVQIISVFGNHEYWGASPFMIENFKHNIENDFKNIKILDCEKFNYNGMNFCGATLWFQRPLERMYEGRMIDYKQIRDFVPWVYDKAGYTRKWMMSNVSENDVVITHHLPTYESVHWKYQGSPLNEYFVHDVKDIVKSTNPKYWIHGHTHESCSYLYGNTQIIANPYGYRGYEINENFNEECIIEL
jgi:Icc-related predicted phosphoesterase